MSTLSLSIIALIVVVLVIVIAHNLWQAYRRSQEDPLADIRAGRLDADPDTLTGAESIAHGRDRREPVLGDAGRRVPPSLAARPAQVTEMPPARGMADGFDEPGADALRAARGEGQHPSLALEDEDFIETPFENPAAVRPWSSREEPASRPARTVASASTAVPAFLADERAGQRGQDERGGWRDRAEAHQPMVAGGRETALEGQTSRHVGSSQGMRRDDWQDEVPMQTLRTSADAGVVPPPMSRTGHGHGAEAAPQAPGARWTRTLDETGAEAPSEGYRHERAAGAQPADQHAYGVRSASLSGHAAEQPAEAALGASDEIAETAATPVAADTSDTSDMPGKQAAAIHEEVELEEWPTAQVEHAVILEPPAPVNTDRLIALTSSLRHVGSKPVRIEVERLGGHWSALAAGDKAVRMRCSLLLANRQGPLNAVELSDFNAAIESLAAQLQAPVSIPDMAPILRVARDLDALAARLDTQIEVIVELSESPDPARMASIARQQGLSDRGHGRYEAFADSGDSLFTLALSKTRDQIVFVLDVPRTAEHHEAWQGMVACASSFAQALGGRLIDSAGRGLSVGMIEAVARQLARRYVELAQAGLAAGQPATLRVFH
ncbi:MAG: cell division protein ZipA C-terminal FtsZ-binding domain-containing protein [Lautropia sp.]|nr:cell division protein ZipA C-terminal FtsZ-binding domain-containing protein [Lautropia sp.]